MAYPKGAKKPVGSGRGKGTPNRVTVVFRDAYEALLSEGVDPLVVLARMANDPTVENSVRVRAAAELAEYIHPKRTRVELQAAIAGVVGSAPLMVQVEYVGRSEGDKAAIASPALEPGEGGEGGGTV